MTGIALLDHWLGFLAMLVVAVALLVAAPFAPMTRGQLLGLVGLMISAAVALSSTTILGNAMAGLMHRAVGNFKVGDFVRTEGHFGRVTERGLFPTEIQTEQRDLVTLPNLFLATHPVRVIRRSGTIVTGEVSLGYDTSHAAVEPLLLAAAAAAGLKEPFVQILELGDFTVSYRVSELLTDVSRLLTVPSRLRSAMLDQLHGGGIEIASPTLMSTRAFPCDQAIKDAADDQARAAAQADRDILERRRDALAETIVRREAEKSEGRD